MTFIVTLIALLIERFFDWGHLRRWSWYENFQRAITRRFTDLSPYAVLALTVIPVLMAVYLIQLLLTDTLFGFVELLFQLLVLLYCLGPKNLWVDAFACMNSLNEGNDKTAQEKLKETFGIKSVSTQSAREQFLNHIFIAANRRVFAIVFWFLILGPVGAVLYRVITLSSLSVKSARKVEAVLDYIPIRIFTFTLALGGHCAKVFSCWNKQTLGLNFNETLLVNCSAAALGGEDIEQVSEDGAAEKNALGLLDRALVITVVAIAIFVWVV